MGAKLKEKPLFNSATDKSPKNLYWVSKWNSGEEGENGVYTTKRIREEDLIDLVLENVVIPTNISAFTNDAGYVDEDTNFANTPLSFESNITHDLSGYTMTLDDANLTIVADTDTSASYPLRIKKADGTTDLFYVRGDSVIVTTAENVQINSQSAQVDFTLWGQTQAQFILRNNAGALYQMYADSNYVQILSTKKFIEPLQLNLVPQGTLSANQISWAYEDDGVNASSLVARWKKTDGTSYKVDFAGTYEP